MTFSCKEPSGSNVTLEARRHLPQQSLHKRGACARQPGRHGVPGAALLFHFLTRSCPWPAAAATMQGWGAWDAAVHLASLSAGKRLAQGGGQQGGGCGAVREPPEGQRLSHTRRWLRWGAKH